LATAEIRNAKTGETVFVFDSAYARVLFAKGINKRNPEIRLPELEPLGDWDVTYDLTTCRSTQRHHQTTEAGWAPSADPATEEDSVTVDK
jgi:hypothetical protein